MKTTKVTGTRHVLPFSNLSDNDFERLCYWLIEESSDFDNVEHYGMTGDKQRDIIGNKHNKQGKHEQWYFQCKNYKKISFSHFKADLDAIKEHSEKEKSFKPSTIVFMVGCSVSPSCKDSTKEHAKRLSLGPVYFWAETELDKKAKASKGVVEEFFRGGISSEEIAKKTAEKIKLYMLHPVQQSGQPAEVDEEKLDEINKEINESRKYIHSYNFEEAKSRLYSVLGKIKNKQKEYAHELARTYNNLGVCFNRLEIEGGDFKRAEEFFKKALEIKPDFQKARINLASVYLNKGGKENFKQAYDIMTQLWDSSDKKDPYFFQIFMWATYHYKTLKDAITYYEKSKEAKTLARRNEVLLNLMAAMYFEAHNLKKAEEFVDLALDLSPNSPQNLSLKATILMARSQKENIIPYEFEVVPKFRNYKDIETALKLFDQAREAVKAENNPFLEALIKIHILNCLLWLNRAKEAKYRDIRASIDISKLDPHQQQQLRIRDYIVELQARNFEIAYTSLIKSPEWAKTEYLEKFRISHIFFLHGAPEQSKNILKELEAEAEQKRDIQFWLEMSLNEVILNDKNLAIKAVQKAKDYSLGTGMEKQVLSHFNALMLRYADSGEVDRLMEGLFDYDKRYPDDKIIRGIKAINDKGELTEEMRSEFIERKEWYKNVRQKFRSRPIPTYFLEKMLNRPYADILSTQDDPEFIFELTIPVEHFEKELLNNLKKSENIVFDYASLLNLSKMNLLGHLERMGKRLYISEELFNKVQGELLMYEQQDLRRLWSFLRHSKDIDIAGESKIELEDKKIYELFDKWIIDSIKLVKEKNAIFVIDDLRFLMFLKSLNTKGCNSFIILKFMLAKGWIDTKIYSNSIGDLAERCYIFLSFSGDDLFQIVLEDKMKITLRSYHLVNQMFLPGSNVISFIGAFIKFINLLWRTGSLPEDKVHWLMFLTDKILEFIDKQGGVQNKQELEKIVPGFVRIWLIAVQMSNKNEIALLENKVGDSLNRRYLTALKDEIKKLIKAKKENFAKNIK